ncbi:hypothetical protein [Ghiorsea bivora]|uniref:hypothetical protein n=1 Tax=Ghiorsea bivora TaxID=1485545 RepID=UPI0012FE2D60|nr:hypothetical protein [Ghiorsea bivora]
MADDTVLVVFTLFTVGLLYLQSKSMVIIVRSFRLLVWLFIPIILLHGFFTPGTYIMGLPISIEGLKQSFSLSLNLACMFFTALLVMQVLKMKYLLQVLQKTPALSQVLLPRLLLLTRLRITIPQLLNKQRMYWQSLEHKWLTLPDVLFESILSILKSSRNEAQLLWEQWDDEVEKLLQVNEPRSKLVVSDLGFGALAILALLGLWL